MNHWAIIYFFVEARLYPLYLHATSIFISHTLSLPYITLSQNEKEREQGVSTATGCHGSEANTMSESKVCMCVFVMHIFSP